MKEDGPTPSKEKTNPTDTNLGKATTKVGKNKKSIVWEYFTILEGFDSG